MINPTEVAKHLKTYLPQVTDLFTEKFTVVSASSTGSVLSVEIAGHGFSVGKSIVINSAGTRNAITSAILTADDTVRFGTQFEHDLTEPQLYGDDQTLTISGVGGAWDGDHQIDSVPSRMFFEIALPTGEVAAPAIGGYLVGETGLGLQVVATVVDVDNFTVDISDLPNMPTGIVDGLTVVSGFRIAAAADIDRAEKVYSRQRTDEPYLFVIMGSVEASKDRHTTSDGIAGFTAQDKMLLRLLQNFSTVVFYPTENDIAGINATDALYGVIYNALIRVLYGFGFTSEGNAIDYVTVSAGHGEGIYNSAYLTHVYDWQLPAAINFENGFNMREDVAFRNIEQSLFLHDDDLTEMSVKINLDEEQT